MITFKMLLEKINWNLPPEPGTHPIPKDHVRLYHQTNEKHLGAIKHQGIKLAHAKGYEGPKAIYADEKGFYGKPDEHPTVEFHVHKDRWKPPFVKGDVDAKDVIAVNRGWHGHARYADKDEDVKKNILSGQHDDLLKDKGTKGYGKSIRYIKHKYGKPK